MRGEVGRRIRCWVDEVMAFLRCELIKWVPAIRSLQCFDTHLNCNKDLTGRRERMSLTISLGKYEFDISLSGILDFGVANLL